MIGCEAGGWRAASAGGYAGLFCLNLFLIFFALMLQNLKRSGCIPDTPGNLRGMAEQNIAVSEGS